MTIRRRRLYINKLARVYYVISIQISAHIRNEARLRGIKKRLVNVENYADGVTSIHLAANLEKI